MNLPYYLARRITFRPRRKATRLVIRLAIMTIAVAVATMEIALSVVQGFEQEIQQKVIGFGGHVQIGEYMYGGQRDVKALPKNEPAIDSIRALPFVTHVSPIMLRDALLNTKEGTEGVRLKGVDETYDWTFFKETLIVGEIPQFGTDTTEFDILLSKQLANLLRLGVGDRPLLFFFPDKQRRRVTIAGIYETGMEEFDRNVVMCDLRLLQPIYRFDENQVMGFEVKVDLNQLEERCITLDDDQLFFGTQYCDSKFSVASIEIDRLLPYVFESVPIDRLYPEIFDWLSFQHQNVWVILILMIGICVINMTVVILIQILERTRMIGMLKAMGLRGGRLMLMFVWNAAFIIGTGVIIGNILGLSVLASQDYFGWFTVNQADYFIKTAPVAWVWERFLLVNVGTIFLCSLFMFIPALVVNQISPVRSIRFA